MTRFLPLLLLLALPVLPSLAAPGERPDVPRFAKFEASWTVPAQAGNPFDPADNDVSVTFTTPRTPPVTTPAFWDGDRWRVRFAPTRTGVYSLRVRRNGRLLAPADLSPRLFRCVPSRDAGFVRRDPRTARRFVFDGGQTYYPLGLNLAWTDDKIPAYGPAFDQMRADGLNWARVWMTFWDGKALDWAQNKANNPKPGVLLLDAARKWDAIFDAAARDGVYVQMTLQHHGQYTEKTDPNWADNPWNAANGGFLTHPDDFFTDARARHWTRLKYRYLAARYGYSTHLLAWELFNEVQNIKEADGHFAKVVAWHREMAATLRAQDVNRHLVTTSIAAPGEPLAGIGLDYDQVHSYVPDIISYFAGLRGPSAPLFTGEWGPTDARAGMTEGFLHDGLWASLCAPVAGAGQFWYGDAVQANGWWPQFASAAHFVRACGVDGLPPGEALAPRVTALGPRAALSVAPDGGWGAATRDRVVLPAGGAAPDLSGVPTFFQGRNHRDLMPRPITFVLDCHAPCRFALTPGTVAKAGAHPVLILDGARAAEADFPAADADHDAGRALTLELTAGPHEVAVANEGQDWFVVQSLSVTGYAPPVAALARGGPAGAVFWAYARDRAAAAPVRAGATLTWDGFAPGEYVVRLWDPWEGHALPPVRAVSRAGSLSVALPAFARDLAGTVTRRAAPGQRQNRIGQRRIRIGEGLAELRRRQNRSHSHA